MRNERANVAGEIVSCQFLAFLPTSNTLLKWESACEYRDYRIESEDAERTSPKRRVDFHNGRFVKNGETAATARYGWVRSLREFAEILDVRGSCGVTAGRKCVRGGKVDGATID